MAHTQKQHLKHRAALTEAQQYLIATPLTRSQQHPGLADNKLAALLQCSLDSLTHLRLCRLPVTDQEGAHIAHRFHADQAALSPLLSDSSEDANAH